jgi:hypothetical protein
LRESEESWPLFSFFPGLTAQSEGAAEQTEKREGGGRENGSRESGTHEKEKEKNSGKKITSKQALQSGLGRKPVNYFTTTPGQS